MARINGQLVICDRPGCGEQIFLKCTGECKTDGFTRWNEFESLPDGWGFHDAVGLLCPKCNAEFTELIKQFREKYESR